MRKTPASIPTRDPLKAVSTFVAVLAVILLVISTFFQGLAIYSVSTSARDLVEENGWLIPVWVAALVLLIAAAIANSATKNNEKATTLPIATAIIGALLALIVALTLRDALPVKVGSGVSINYEQGLDGWKLTYRHLSSVFAGGLTAIAAIINRISCRNVRIRTENEQYESVYDFGDAPIFADENQKMKRSKKAALRKEQE